MWKHPRGVVHICTFDMDPFVDIVIPIKLSITDKLRGMLYNFEILCVYVCIFSVLHNIVKFVSDIAGCVQHECC